MTPGSPPAAHLQHQLCLPPGFRLDDVLSFHRRDAQALAEEVSNHRLVKGLVWRGAPALLTLTFTGDAVDAQLNTEAPATAQALQPHFEAMVTRMLGLTQDVDAFEQKHRHHPALGPLLARQSGLRVPVTATPFEALSWAITGQQISVQAAVAIRRRMIAACNVRHRSGWLCHPQAPELLNLGESGLRDVGFTASKARTVLAVSAAVQDGSLPLDDWLQRPPDDIGPRLLAIKGIGPWTVSYALLRGFGWLDGSLHGDVAVRKALGALLHQDASTATAPITPQDAEAWLAPFSPWRALVAAHLWASLSMNA